METEAQVGREGPILQGCGQRLALPSLALWLLVKVLLSPSARAMSRCPKPWAAWEKADSETSGRRLVPDPLLHRQLTDHQPEQDLDEALGAEDRFVE